MSSFFHLKLSLLFQKDKAMSTPLSTIEHIIQVLVGYYLKELNNLYF